MITERSSATGREDAPLIELQADFTEDQEFGRRTLRITHEAVTVTEPGGAELLHVPISDIAEARNAALVGGGRLELELKTGERIAAVTYSVPMVDAFSDAANSIQRLIEGDYKHVEVRTPCLFCDRCKRDVTEKEKEACTRCLDKGKTLVRVGAFLKPYKKQVVFLAVFSILRTVFSLIPPAIQGRLIDHIAAGGTSVAFLMQMLGLWAMVLSLGVGAQILSGRIVGWLGTQIAADLRTAVYRAIEFLNLAFFEKRQVGAIASRVMQDTDRIWGFLVDGVPFFLVNGMMLIGVIGFMFYVDWILALSILAPFPIIALISLKFWRPLSRMFHKVGSRLGRLHTQLNESLHGIRVVKAFVSEDTEFDKFQERNHSVRDAGAEAEVRWITVFGMMTFFMSIGIVINWAVGGYFVFIDRMSIGEFWMVNGYLLLIYGPLQWFASVYNWSSRAIAGAERVFEIIDTKPESRGSDKRTTGRIEGAVEFQNVRFGYDKSNPVIKGVSFKAQPGEMIGLVGHSGAGKSTTINLLCRFYEPDGGRILIDGKDYRDCELHDYRSQIGIVLQEPFLFNGTIAENIAYGKPGASFDEVMQAAKAANAHDFVVAKPNGYDTICGERGIKLSGGEKQRISIARAVLHNPRILILDEATSSVDVETEREIQQAISRLIAGRTTFAIAHRLSTLRNADRLVVLEGGQISEMGTHAELMDRKGAFHRLVMTQSAVNEIIGVGA